MQNFPDMMGRMITGQQMRDARVRAGLSRDEVATLLEEKVKNVGNWERTHVPKGKEALVRDLLFPENPLAQYDDLTLLMELGRRLAATRPEPETGSRQGVDTSPGQIGAQPKQGDRPNRPAPRAVEGRGPRRR